MSSEVGTTTICSADTLTNSYALMDDDLVTVDGTNKWFQLYAETQTVLEVVYTTGSGETSNNVEFYIEFGSGSVSGSGALKTSTMTWVRETVEYMDDSANQIVLEEWTYKIDGASAGTAYTKRIQLPVCTKGIRIYAKETGVVTNYGNLTIKANTVAAGSAVYNRSLQTMTIESLDVQLGAVELKDGTTDARQTIRVDNATATATPTVAIGGAIYKNALDTYNDNDAAPIPVTANGVPIVAITSGAALTPIFDTAGHRGYVQLTNGTIEPVITAAATETLALATDYLTVAGLCYGMDANNGTPILAAMQVAIDNTTISATPNTLIVGGIYKAAFDTYNDNDAVPFHFDVDGKLVTSTGQTDDSAFTAASSNVMPMGGFYDSSDDEVNDGDIGALKMTVQRRLEIRSEAYDTSTQADKSVEQAPVYTHNIGDTLADVTDETSAPTTNYYYLDMEGYKFFTIQAETSDATPTDVLVITIEASCQDDGTAQASCAYDDVTNELFGVANWTDTDFMAICDTATAFKYVRVKTVTTGAGDDCDYTIYARRTY